MSRSANTNEPHGEESQEEMLAKLLLINAFITNAKKERTRLFDKIARMVPDPDGFGLDGTTRSTEISEDGQVLQSELDAMDVKSIKSDDLKSSLEDARTARQEFKTQPDSIPIQDDETGKLDGNHCGQNSLGGNWRPGDDEQSSYWQNFGTIGDPPSSQHFPYLHEERGCPVRLPACVRHVFSQESGSISHDSVNRNAISFQAIVDINTSDNFVSSSFILPNVTTNDVFFDETTATFIPLPDHHTINFTFSPHCPHDDPKTSGSHLGVSGVIGIPIEISGFTFWSKFVICKQIFDEEKYNRKFPAVIGARFLSSISARLQWTSGGWLIRLPPPPPEDILNIFVYVHGCVVDAGAAATKDSPARISKCGYGIHFPTLPEGWDLHTAFTCDEYNATIEQAEISAIARTLEVVYTRSFRACRNKSLPTKFISKCIVIFTTSNYAIDGFHEKLSRWRVNGFKTNKKKTVKYVECWKFIDVYNNLLAARGVTVALTKATTKENMVAEKLARMGASDAQAPPPEQLPLTNTQERAFLGATQPLIQIGREGSFWVRNRLSKVGTGMNGHDTGERRQNGAEAGKDAEEAWKDSDETERDGEGSGKDSDETTYDPREPSPDTENSQSAHSATSSTEGIKKGKNFAAGKANVKELKLTSGNLGWD